MPPTVSAPSARESSPYAGHIPSLDGVRGLAILVVMLGHLFSSNNVSNNVAVRALLALRDLSWVGVNLFFALSGFLITGILYDTLGVPEYFRSFYGRRLLRISPLYYAVILTLLALTPFLDMHWNGSAVLFLTYTQNLPYMNHPPGPAPWANLRHFWSLAVEEQFYVLWPLVLFWLKGWKKIFIATLVGAGVALVLRTALALKGGFPQNHSTPTCMDALLLGGTLALLVRGRYRDAVLRWGLPVFCVAAVAIVVPALRQPDFNWVTSAYLTTIGLTIVNAGAVGLIAAALLPESCAWKFFSAPTLRFFGKYSYGLYVFHSLVDAIFAQHLREFFASPGLGKVEVVLLTGCVTFAISVAAALLSYYGFERYFLHLKRLFPYSRPQKPIPE